MIAKNIGVRFRYGIWAILSGLTTLAYGLQPANATPYYFVDSYATVAAAQSAATNSYFAAIVGSNPSYRESFESYTPPNSQVSAIETNRVKIHFADNAAKLYAYEGDFQERGSRYGQSATDGSRYVFLEDGVTSVQPGGDTSVRQRDLIIEFKGQRVGDTTRYDYPTGVSFDIRDFADHVNMNLAVAIVDFVDEHGNEVESRFTDYTDLTQYTTLLTHPRADGLVDRISIYDDTHRIKRIRLAALGAAGKDSFALDNLKFFTQLNDPGPDGERGTSIYVPYVSEPEGIALFPLAALFYLTRRRALQREAAQQTQAGSVSTS